MPDLTQEISDYQRKAMDAVFQLCEAVTDGNLTIGDIAEVVKLAVSQGHDHIQICLAMTANAVRIAGEERSDA